MAICLFMSLLFIHSMSIFLDKLQTTKTLSRVELEALSARIRPHFLYNSLNTIAELTQGDKNDAEQAVLSLAQLCKAAMRTSELTTLRAELELARQYIKLERWRYAQRLDVRWYLPEHIPDVTLPVLSVQPLLENAIVYGVEPQTKPTRIDIELLETQAQVSLKISNQYSQEKVNQYAGEGIAQDNIKARLALHFGGRATLNTEQSSETYTVMLTFSKDSA
jgi:two-component system sensor histidine kinase AlgZ